MSGAAGEFPARVGELVPASGIHRGGPRRRGAYSRFTAPIRAYAIADDAYAPSAAVEAFLGFYPNVPRKRVDWMEGR